MYTRLPFFPNILHCLCRLEHFEVVYHIFAYLNEHDKSRIIFDPTDPMPFTPTTGKPDWPFFYHNLEEQLSPRRPKPLRHPVNVYTFVNAKRIEGVNCCC
jgi:hypothetical protein